MDIINKTYKRKDSNDNDIFTVSSIDNDFVLFDNNARCKLSTFISDFEEIKPTINSTNVELNPDTFFSGVNIDESLLEQLETLHKNPNIHIPPTQPISPETQNNIINNNTQINSIKKPQENRLPEWDVFDNVKLSEEIEILIPFKIKVPKAEKIDILNDMFKTTFTSYIAKKYINTNIINNSSNIQLLIQNGIENWIDSEINGNTKKITKKSVKKNNDTTKIIIPDIKLTEQPKIHVKQNEQSTASFFGVKTSTWDGDIKKLYLIETEEQYNVVKQKYDQLKIDGINTSEIDRLELLLETYTI